MITHATAVEREQRVTRLGRVGVLRRLLVSLKTLKVSNRLLLVSL